MRPVRFERSDGQDHERVRGQPTLEGAGIKLEQPSRGFHGGMTEPGYLTRAERSRNTGGAGRGAANS